MNFFYLNDLENAEGSFLKALSLNPDDLESGYQLGYLYTLQKKFQQAETHLNHIYRKLEVRSRTQALSVARDLNLLPSR